MLQYVCLMFLATAAYAQGQQVPGAMVNPTISMPNIPAGASLLGTVAAANGQQQQQQQGAQVPVNAMNGQAFIQQSSPFGAYPMIGGPQPVMTARQFGGSPVPAPNGGPLASLAAQQTLANSLVPRGGGGSSGFNPLLFALSGGNDNLLPMMMMSQPGLFQRNPLMGMMMMNNM